MLGRRQEINLQLTQLLDSGLLAFCLWFAHYFRSRTLPVFIPDLVEIPPIEQLYWLMALVVPFTPLILEERGFYSGLVEKTTAQSLRQLMEALAGISLAVGALVVFLKWEVPSRSVAMLAIVMSGSALLLREEVQRARLRRRLDHR